MAQIEEGVFRSYRNGDRMTDADYNRDREIIRQAINDLDRQVQQFQSDTVVGLVPEIETARGGNDSLGVRLEGVDADIGDLYGINNHSILPTYTDGQLTAVEEKDGETVVSSASITYNLDGTVNTVTEVVDGSTVVTTLNYVDGEFSSVSKVVL